MQAIILAGGFGTRLRDVVGDIPKPMADIGGKPFLARTIENLERYGVTEIVLSVHHLAERIMAYFGEHYHGVAIRYAHETTPLGTGGALKHAMEILQPTAPVLAMNGDTFVQIDYGELYHTHIAAKTPVTMVLKHLDDCHRYGQVMVKEACITAFHPRGEGAGCINAGSYVLNPDVFHDMPAMFSFEHDFMTHRVEQMKPHGYITDGYFIDIGIPADYEKARKELKEHLRY